MAFRAERRHNLGMFVVDWTGGVLERSLGPGQGLWQIELQLQAVRS